VLWPIREQKGEGAARRHVSTRGGSGDASQSARGGRRPGGAGWLGRPKAESQWWLVAAAQKEGKESGPAGVEGEAGRGWAEFEAGQEFKKNSFRISLDFRI
jgi:hypothetical protein